MTRVGMSSQSPDQYWSFVWNPSYMLLFTRLSVAILTGIALCLTPLGTSGLSISALLAGYGIYAHSRQPIALFAEGSRLTLESRDGRRVVVHAERAYKSGWLQVLWLRCWRGRRHTLVVTPDSGDREQRHLWRCFLAYGLSYKSDDGHSAAD